MSTTLARDSAQVAATMPMALHAVADHMTTHALPAPVDISVPGALIGDTELPAVAILLDSRSTARWIGSLDSATEVAITEHSSSQGRPVGSWHEVLGVANCVRVRLSWWVSVFVVDDHDDCDEVDEAGDEPVEPLGPRALAMAREHAFGEGSDR